MKTAWYITTAIPYVNARPHIGFALEIVLTDALARFQRLRGRDVWFLTGTDENSLKSVQAAEKEGISTEAFVERNAGTFYQLKQLLNLSFDDFIRTSTDPRHIAGVQKLWQACIANGDIYKKVYGGLYCVGCEQFYAEDELIDGLCPEHFTRPEWVEEENYFFRLSRYQEKLLALLESGELRVEPPKQLNAVLSFVRRGLQDFSVSRSQARARGWGVPVPDDPTQVMYVWFDALGNYITALDYATHGERYQHYWVQNPDRIHVIGKGITRFHTVYWPAMLLSAGTPLPTAVFVHGYVSIGGNKISKALGNVIDPVDLVRQYGVDSVRYYLLREIRATDDGDYTVDRFLQAHNGDLADRLGNLLNRTVRMVESYYAGIVPNPDPTTYTDSDQRLLAIAAALPSKVEEAISQFLTHEALLAIWELVSAGNKYVDETQPWTLGKKHKAGDPVATARLGTILYNLLESLRLVADLCQPFLPQTSSKIAEQLNLPLAGEWEQLAIWGRLHAGISLRPAAILFPKYEPMKKAPDETGL